MTADHDSKEESDLRFLEPGGPWDFYESPSEIAKVVRRTEAFLKPHLARLGVRRVLEVGCGSGHGTLHLRNGGFDAWGVDPHFRDDVSEVQPFLLKGDGRDLPFDDREFDASYALEVIEHVGTRDGFLQVADDHREQRLRFVCELARVSTGSVIIATPNKRFPIDEHAQDEQGALSFRVHSPFEAATLSVGDLATMFGRCGFGLVEYLDPAGYYALERVQRSFGRLGTWGSRLLLELARHPWTARSPLNPHLFLRFERLPG